MSGKFSSSTWHWATSRRQRFFSREGGTHFHLYSSLVWSYCFSVCFAFYYKRIVVLSPFLIYFLSLFPTFLYLSCHFINNMRWDWIFHHHVHFSIYWWISCDFDLFLRLIKFKMFIKIYVEDKVWHFYWNLVKFSLDKGLKFYKKFNYL